MYIVRRARAGVWDAKYIRSASNTSDRFRRVGASERRSRPIRGSDIGPFVTRSSIDGQVSDR